VNVLLSPEERLVLQLIETRRQKRSEEGDSPSEIVADALWYYLEQKEQMSRAQIEALLPDKPKGQNQPQSNLKQFPK
jgi:hypothetical protein